MEAAKAPVIACDVPSGVDATTGEVEGPAVHCIATATFHRPKVGLWTRPGKEYAGEVEVVDIGIPKGGPARPEAGLIGATVLREVPRRSAASTKFSSGNVFIIGGSRGLTGAPCMSALAAMRAGAGYVTVGAPASLELSFTVRLLEAMVVGLPEDDGGGFTTGAAKAIGEHAGKVDAVVAGPGMAEGQASARIADALIMSDPRVALDAALLHSLKPAQTERRTPPLLLPHSGELASLLDCDEEEIERDPVGCGHRAAERYRAIVLVKGVTSHVVTPEADVWTYEGGAPGLGVSGSGDVLAGIVGGLLARGAEPLSALLWAVWLHGEAGAALAKKVGPIGFLAREIAGEIPALLAR